MCHAGRGGEPMIVGERLIGASQHLLGDQPSAWRHIERALEDDVAPDHRSDIIRFEMDQRVTTRVYLGRALWLLGFPDQAMRAAHDSVEAARAGCWCRSSSAAVYFGRNVPARRYERIWAYRYRSPPTGTRRPLIFLVSCARETKKISARPEQVFES